MKNLKSTFFLAGTAIGSGMISLPLVLATLGTGYSCIFIICTAIVTYFSALIRCELNLNTQCDSTLKEVGQKFSGPIAAWIGDLGIKTLSFTLLTAYIFGLSALIDPQSYGAKFILGGLIFIILLCPTRYVLIFNKFCFFSLIALVAYFTALLWKQLNSNDWPMFAANPSCQLLWTIIPTLFTSFGFQGSLHSLTKFCDNDAKRIQSACFWGCVITALIYITWTLCIIGALQRCQPQLFSQMTRQLMDVPEFIHVLESICQRNLKTEITLISILTILTSIIGVGTSLMDDLQVSLKKFPYSPTAIKLICVLLTVMPATLIAAFWAKAFVTVLSFAGFILSTIAIFLPLFLFLRLKRSPHFLLLKRPIVLFATFLFGIIVIVCECFNLF